MSTPSLETTLQPPAQARLAELPNPPYACITVEHVLNSNTPFYFSVTAQDGVDVETTGSIAIHWGTAAQQAELQFELTTSPDSSWFDGLLLGFKGEDVPTDSPPFVTFSLEAPPTARAQVAPRVLVVRVTRPDVLNPTGPIYTYCLHVAYTNGESARIDPKIYNDGNGGGDGERQPR